MENLSLDMNLTLNVLPLLILGLPLLAWIALYARGAEARDLLFWGAISVVIPVLGPVVAIIFALRLQSFKTKRGKAIKA